MSFEGFDGIEGLLKAGQIPVGLQVRPMDVGPFQHGPESPFGKSSLHDARLDLDGDLVAAVFRVKVGRGMVPVEHADDDSKKAADLGHDWSIEKRV